MSWSTPAEASNITGDVIEQTHLDQAQALLEIFVGVTEDALPNLKPRDIRLLKKMEAYQAAWMIKQVDLTGRSDVTLVDQDGLSYSKGDDDMHVMAPLAKRAYKRLSWNRTRTLDPLSPTQALALRGKQSAETIGISGSSSSGSAYDPDDFYYGGWERI